MLTRWGETLDKQQVLQEYPRPQLVRESFYPLNGLWDYAITASDACPGAWDGRLTTRRLIRYTGFDGRCL